MHQYDPTIPMFVGQYDPQIARLDGLVQKLGGSTQIFLAFLTEGDTKTTYKIFVIDPHFQDLVNSSARLPGS